MKIKSLVISLVVILILSAVGIGYAYQQFMQQTVTQQTRLITISNGQSARTVIASLTGSNPWQIKVFTKVTSIHTPALLKLKAGTYELSAGVNLTQALEVLASGNEKLFAITLVEGLRWQDWLEQLQHAPYIGSQPFDADRFLSSRDVNALSLEGVLLPDTYYYSAGTPIGDIVERAYQAMQTLLETNWPKRQQELPLSTPYQALILASIIEKETGVADERPLIAGVFVNRLRLNMRLQTDPTVIYGMGDRFDGDIRRADLRARTPYNTYVIKGLPPTPIAMPSKAAVLAALQPQATDALYFVAKGDGSHKFSRTLQEHNAAVRKYQLKQE